MSEVRVGSSKSELLPCPFCGGEADVFTYNNEEYDVKCRNPYCLAKSSRWDTEAEAIAAWNTRVVRTCKFVSSKGSDYPPVCSACGYELGIYDCEWFEDGTYGYERNYCPNCGAKVVCE